MTERDLFIAAVQLDPAERPALLDRECANDPSLRQRVERLLKAHAEAGSAFGPQVATIDYETAASSPLTTGAVGTVLGGRYKLLEEIGEGGMGTVFMAEQAEPVKRIVAVKIIKAGMDSKAVFARFEAERQALAMMDHPNIARVLDAGSTDSGRPFFVMELVKGMPITKYCDEHRLTPRQRLELFIPVCQAIQHAHQKGIIHRDIKPSNVLVAMYDDRPVPKVIDFGVAKATGQPLTDKTLLTGFGALVGTPEYMSPEQASLNNLDIDTRSDVYSLGVLLYELLTGTTPLDRKWLGEAALLEVLRIVREVEVPRPSTKLSSSQALPSIAANRNIEPARLAEVDAGRARLGSDEGPGKGPYAALRDGQRPGTRHPALSGGRSRGSPPAEHRLPAAEVRPPAQAPGGSCGTGVVGLAGGHHRHDVRPDSGGTTEAACRN